MTITLVMALLLVLAAACAPAPQENPPASTPAFTPELTPTTAERGTIEVRVTDPPPAAVKSAIVYLTNIKIHKVSGNTSQWITIIGVPPSFDLMAVIGVEKILGSANITAGSFTQIRLDVDRVEGTTTDNVSYTAEIPSGELKIVGAFNVEPGIKTILTLDFDGEKSLIITGGKAGKVLFKPVVKLLIKK